jgi:hypothetical protein
MPYALYPIHEDVEKNAEMRINPIPYTLYPNPKTLHLKPQNSKNTQVRLAKQGKLLDEKVHRIYEELSGVAPTPLGKVDPRSMFGSAYVTVEEEEEELMRLRYAMGMIPNPKR